MKTNPIFTLSLWVLRCSFALISVNEASAQVILPFIPNSARTPRHVAPPNPTTRSVTTGSAATKSVTTRRGDHSRRNAANGPGQPDDETDGFSKPASTPSLHVVPLREEPPSETSMTPEETFATLLTNARKIQNSNFGKRPKMARLLGEIVRSVQKLRQFSRVRRNISSSYLYGLTVDAWELGNVAAAISEKSVFFRPIPDRTTVGENSFSIFFAAPDDDHDPGGKGSMSRDTRIFSTRAAGGSEALSESVNDVHSDLSAKTRFAEKNPTDPFKSVTVNVRTRKEKNELSGYEVWYSLKGLLRYPDRLRQFDQESSPTSCPLPPGNYVLWTRDGSAEGTPRRLGDLGSDGQPERLIDPLFIP
jgi:hypothetical protein